METIEIKVGGRIKTKGFDISIGLRTDMIALISHSTGYFATFSSIKKGGRLSKIKSKFKSKICSSQNFFFENMTETDIYELIKILKK